MSQIYNDGQVPYGARVEAVFRSSAPFVLPAPGHGGVITGGAFPDQPLGNYIFENITVTRKTKKVERMDQLGSPNGGVATKDLVEGSCTIQIPTGASTEPAAGDIFTDTFDATLGPETFVIHDVGAPFAAGDYYKRPASIRKVQFPGTFVSAPPDASY